jgi:hypothetical protein
MAIQSAAPKDVGSKLRSRTQTTKEQDRAYPKFFAQPDNEGGRKSGYQACNDEDQKREKKQRNNATHKMKRSNAKSDGECKHAKGEEHSGRCPTSGQPAFHGSGTTGIGGHL